MRAQRILIIEDETDIRKVLRKRLEARGHDVIDASEGYEGLYKYLRQKPALIILDIMMPGLDGYEVCREIRRELGDVRTPIIMLTAKGEDYDRIKGRVIGATHYMTKPFDGKELIKLVDRCLNEAA